MAVIPDDAFVSWMDKEGVWYCTTKDSHLVGSGPSMLHARLSYLELLKNENS